MEHRVCIVIGLKSGNFEICCREVQHTNQVPARLRFQGFSILLVCVMDVFDVRDSCRMVKVDSRDIVDVRVINYSSIQSYYFVENLSPHVRSAPSMRRCAVQSRCFMICVRRGTRTRLLVENKKNTRTSILKYTYLILVPWIWYLVRKK